MIKVRYYGVDGARMARSFKSLAGARKFAVAYVGKSPEMGRGYAISGDGIGKVEVSGISLAELFGVQQAAPARCGRELSYAEWQGDFCEEPEPVVKAFAVLRRSPIYCQITDAIIGSSQSVEAEFDSLVEAEAFARKAYQEEYDGFGDDRLYPVYRAGKQWVEVIYPYVAPAGDEIPF